MDRGYFAGLRANLYRRTRDGQLVVARRTLPRLSPQWFIVRPEDKAAFERRVVQAHVASLTMVVIAVQFLRTSSFQTWAIVLAALSLVTGPVMWAWMTKDLPRAQVANEALEPVNRRLQQLEYARALGSPTLIGFLGVAVLLLALQLYMLVTDHAWWSWLGTGMFGATAGYFGWLLFRLRTEGLAAPTT